MLTCHDAEDQLFGALADRTRRKILRTLAAEPMPVHRLATAFDVTRPAVSRHLRILREAGIVDVVEAGRENVYYLRTSALRDIEDWLHGIWSRRLTKLKALVEEMPSDAR